MKKHIIPLFFFGISVLAFFGCKDETLNQQAILGTWISEDKKDTLDFVDSINFYKNRERYYYKLYNDSIDVKYNGMLKILVYTTKHKYSLVNNVLVIDFSNKACYGFELKKMNFMKK